MLRELEALPTSKAASRLAVVPARTGEYYAAADGERAFEATHLCTHELLARLGSEINSFDVAGCPEEDLGALNARLLLPFQALEKTVWAAAACRSFQLENFSDIAYSVPEYLKPAYVTSSKKEK
jgi:hypothetical protein